MPLVLSTNEATESRISYADVTGIEYEYPSRYRKLIHTGERFVYYRGRRLPGGKTRPQQYFGAGVIGEVAASKRHTGRLVCRIHDYREFTHPVGLRWPDGSRVEPGGAKGGLYYRTGVRTLTDDEYGALIEAGHPGDISPAVVYASPQSMREVDAYAMRTAVAYLRTKYPAAVIKRMPHNNPGFDIEVSPSESSIIYVEVKGTQGVVPRFFMSEGERVFASTNSRRYSLLIIYDIDLVKESHLMLEHAGEPEERFMLKPSQWTGTLK